MLVIVCGLPGTGKSFLSKKLAERIQAEHLNTDKIRKELFPKPSYSGEEKQKVYEEMLSRAGKFLAGKKNVILDGTFFKKALRKRVYELAEENQSAYYIIECIAPSAKVEKRIAERAKEASESDADVEVYKTISREFEPIEEAHLSLDTSLPIEKQLSLVENFLAGD